MSETRAPLELARHHLVWVEPCAAMTVAGQLAERAPAARDRVRDWIARGNPLVVARRSRASEIALGLPLPPDEGKQRIAVTVRAHEIARARPPLGARDALATAAHLRPPLAALDDALRHIGVELSVFGSLAWQALTGLAYVTGDSDIDILVHLHDRSTLARITASIARVEAGFGTRFDGEIVFGESAASLREWMHTRADCVLVKRASSVAIVARDALLATLARGVACC